MATIALFGDSTIATSYLLATNNPALETYHGKTAGYDGRTSAQLQAELIGHTVTNYGLDGMDSSEALSTAFADPTKWALCLASAPGVVVIQFGPNDSAAGISIATFKANIGQMIADCQAAGIVPVLTSGLWVDWYGGHATIDYNKTSSYGAYYDAMVQVASAYGITLVDTRLAFKNSIEAGTWDLFGHNDTTYLAAWENGTTTTQAGYWSNIHPWIEGVALWASTVADRLALTEPLFGGSESYAGRSTGMVYSMSGSVDIPGVIDDYIVHPRGAMLSRLRDAAATITPGVALGNVVRASTITSGGAGHVADFDSTAYATHPVNGLSQLKGAVFVMAEAPPQATGSPRLWCWSSSSTNLVSIYRSGSYIKFATYAAGALSSHDHSIPTAGMHVFCLTWDNTRSAPPRGYIDGVISLLTPANQAMPTGLIYTPVVGNRLAAAEYANCAIQRVLIVSGRVPTDAEIAQVSEAMLEGYPWYRPARWLVTR